MTNRVDVNQADFLFSTRRLNDYESFVEPGVLEKIRQEAQPLAGCSVLRLNATPFGGGVAEMVPHFAGLMNDLDIETHWLTIASPLEEAGYNPPPEFFGLTSGLHYHLQDSTRPWVIYEGEGEDAQSRPVADTDLKLYQQINRKFAAMAQQFQAETGKAQVVISDDPQCLAAVEAKQPGQKWIWRFHLDGDINAAWSFLTPYILQHDAVVTTKCHFLPPQVVDNVPTSINYPFVDPLHEKLQPLSVEAANDCIADFGVDPARPILVQVSRFDPDKDPLGVIEVFHQLRARYPDMQFIYSGPFAYDNPTSLLVLEQMEAAAHRLGYRLNQDVFFLHSATPEPRGCGYRELAALWRMPNTYIVQLSTREGFGMVVAEAAWCGKAVVGTRVGGIVDQIRDGETGFLVAAGDYAAVAAHVARLIDDPALAETMGRQAHAYIRDNFLITANLYRWLRLINRLLDGHPSPM